MQCCGLKVGAICLDRSEQSEKAHVTETKVQDGSQRAVSTIEAINNVCTKGAISHGNPKVSHMYLSLFFLSFLNLVLTLSIFRAYCDSIHTQKGPPWP